MVKSISKKLILFLLLIVLTVSLCGCASVRAMTITNIDGSIEEQVYVSLNIEEILKNNKYSINEIKQDVETTAINIGNNIKNNLEQKIFVDLLTCTEDTKETLKEFRDGIEILSNNWKNNNIYLISIKFKNIDVYKYYYNIKDNSKVETKTVKHFLYNKIYFYGNTMYLKYNELYNSIKQEFENKYVGLIDSPSNELLYTYKTDLRRQHSNADYITRSNGEYYHTWIVEDVENEEILFHYTVANKGVWILISVGISLLVCGILFIVYKLKNKKIK